jgi:hypothetical protein
MCTGWNHFATWKCRSSTWNLESSTTAYNIEASTSKGNYSVWWKWCTLGQFGGSDAQVEDRKESHGVHHCIMTFVIHMPKNQRT